MAKGYRFVVPKLVDQVCIHNVVYVMVGTLENVLKFSLNWILKYLCGIMHLYAALC